MLQTIIPIGNSYGVIIPKEVLDKLGLKQGDKMFIKSDINKKAINMAQNEKDLSSTVTPEFYDWLDKVSTKYEKAIKELAHK